MRASYSTWSALCLSSVALVKHAPIPRLALRGGVLLLCLFIAACGSTSALAPVGHADKRAIKTKKVQRKSTARVHVVRKGETLYSIAFQHGQDYRQLARKNGIKHPYTIFIGQKLTLKGQKRASSSTSSRTKPSKSTKSGNKPAKTSPKTAKKQTNKPKVAKKTAIKGPVHWKWPSKGKLGKTYLKKDPTRKGIDINGRLGQPVLAAATGKIVYSGSGLRGYGKLIIVKHNERFLSAYAHNRKLLVKEGAQVKQGQRIAEMGRSGTDKVKLHFEIRRDGKPVDPLRYLPKR